MLDDERYARMLDKVESDTLISLSKSIARSEGRPATLDEIELVVDWVHASWFTGTLVDMVLDGDLLVTVREGRLTFVAAPLEEELVADLPLDDTLP